MAESVGFEPTEPFSSSDFKSGAFDHSANSPFTTYYILIGTTCQPLFKKVWLGWEDSNLRCRDQNPMP